MTETSGPRPVRAYRGTQLNTKGWQQEAALRMLQNNLDPEVAEHPDDLVVYGGTGRAARSWGAYDAIVRELKQLEDDETLLVQSGKPVGVMRTNEWAPRVLIANSNLVGDWATWPEFRRLEAEGLMMYGQMTAGSWIYIGTQGILQGTFETFAAVARTLGRESLAGTITLTAGLGGMGGAQPLAVTMNDGVAICVDVDRSRIDRRIEHRYLDVLADDIDEVLTKAVAARDEGRGLSIGLHANAADVFPQLLEMQAPIDIVTDQTSAHDPLAYLPSGYSFDTWSTDRERDAEQFTADARASMAKHVEAMVGFQKAGAEVFDYGNSIRAEAVLGGFDDAFAFPGFVPAYIRPLFCEGKGPFRWAALSGDPADIAATDRAILELFPEDEHLRRWITLAGERVQFQGLPARICWLGAGERHRAGLKFNEMVASGELSAPVVIGRDHLDSGSVASPYRETEAMKDGSDAIADWPLLNALVNTASGASWVSLHHGGGVGIGRSIHAGQVTVADGTELAAQKLERVLSNDPEMGVIRHVDAGYDEAIDFAESHDVAVPIAEAVMTSLLITGIGELTPTMKSTVPIWRPRTHSRRGCRRRGRSHRVGQRCRLGTGCRRALRRGWAGRAAGLGRLPYAHGVRGRPHRRVRGSHGWRGVCRRRYQCDGRCDARGLRRRAAGWPRPTGRRSAARRHHRLRDQDRLRAHGRRRGSVCAHREHSGRLRDLPRSPPRASRQRRRRIRLARVRRDARGGRAARRLHRCASASAAPSMRRSRAACSRQGAMLASPSACTAISSARGPACVSRSSSVRRASITWRS